MSHNVAFASGFRHRDSIINSDRLIDVSVMPVCTLFRLFVVIDRSGYPFPVYIVTLVQILSLSKVSGWEGAHPLWGNKG